VLNYTRTTNVAQAAIYSIEGKKLVNISIPNGSVQTSVDASTLPKGLYVLQWLNNSTIKTIKFLKQ
jgi:Secretion system C-terminal sorting domain